MRPTGLRNGRARGVKQLWSSTDQNHLGHPFNLPNRGHAPDQLNPNHWGVVTATVFSGSFQGAAELGNDAHLEPCVPEA